MWAATTSGDQEAHRGQRPTSERGGRVLFVLIASRAACQVRRGIHITLTSGCRGQVPVSQVKQVPMSKSSGDSQRSCRQAQGLACDECRARKLRCDRARPTCGTCETLGLTCTPNTTRQPRGPRRGHLKALQSRISKCIDSLARPREY
jgi:hypothetical protein